MTPLDSDVPFHVEFMNPKPLAKVLKDGPRYTLTFEVHKELFDAMMEAKCLPGMVLEGQLHVVHQGRMAGPRPYGHIVSALFQRGFFYQPKVRESLEDYNGNPSQDNIARQLAKELGYESIGEVPPYAVGAWCRANEIPMNALPEVYR